MKIKTIIKIISLILINGLTALFIFQINFAGGKNAPTKAQTAIPNYSAVWTASKCRELTDSTRINPRGVDTYPEDLRLGVAEWQVEYSGDFTGKEKWIVPDNGWIDVYAINGNYKYQKFETESCNDTLVSGSPPKIVTGLYGYSIEANTVNGVPAGSTIGGSYPKSWKVCKVNEFTDPCS